MLKKIKILDYDSTYMYAPGQIEAVINTDEIVSAKPTEARGIGPFLLLRFKDGSYMTMVGKVGDIL